MKTVKLLLLGAVFCAVTGEARAENPLEVPNGQAVTQGTDFCAQAAKVVGYSVIPTANYLEAIHLSEKDKPSDPNVTKMEIRVLPDGTKGFCNE